MMKGKLDPREKLTFGERLGYSFGGYGINITFSLLSSFLLVYYVSVAGANPAVAAGVIAVSRIFDGLSDLIMGYIVDHTKSRFGKARPWIIRLSLPLAVCTVLMFGAPSGLGGAGLTAYMFITYNLVATVFYTGMSVPFNSMNGFMTLVQYERGLLGNLQFITSTAATMTLNTILLKMTRFFGNGEQYTHGGWRISIAILMAAAVICNIFCFLLCRAGSRGKKGRKAKRKNSKCICYKNCKRAGFKPLLDDCNCPYVYAEYHDVYILWFRSVFCPVPEFIIKGIIASHFNLNPQNYGTGHTAEASYVEIQKIMKLMNVENSYPICQGAEYPLENEKVPRLSEGAELIIREAMAEDEHPLFIACQGALTDLASAIMIQPEICNRMTAIWIGGGAYPDGGFEFNCKADLAAANVLMKSQMPVWQIPINVYKQMAVSLAELQVNVAPCGKIGEYLFTQMVEFNDKCAQIQHWPHGEVWGLGDSPAVGVLLEESERTDIYDMIPAPEIRYEDMTYSFDHKHREIRVYNQVNARLIIGDLFAKLRINFGG